METVDFEERGRLQAILVTMSKDEAIHWLRNLAVFILYEIETRENEKMMEDKKVGEQWYWCQDEQPVDGKDELVDAMRDLIRKLVEERKGLYYKKHSKEHREKVALRDFGIDPKDFK